MTPQPKPRQRGDVHHIPRAIREAEDAIRRKVRDVARSYRDVLAHLVKHACQENLAEPVFPRVSTLCEVIGISPATCYRAFDSLSIAGYIERLPKDPWGNPYQYLNPGVRGEIDVFSYGADGAPGGEGNDADIGSWNL